MEKLIEKLQNADGYVVLTVNIVEGIFKTKIDYSESMSEDNVNDLILQVADVIKNRKK